MYDDMTVQSFEDISELLREYYAKKDILGEYEKILERYDYSNKTAEQLLYNISENGLRDSLASKLRYKKQLKVKKLY